MIKIQRAGTPLILACLFLGTLIYLAGLSSRAEAAGGIESRPRGENRALESVGGTQASLLVTTLQDELNEDGDCSLREAIEAANTNAPIDVCGAGDVLTDTITFNVEGIIIVTSQLSVTAGGPLVIDGGNVITTSGNGLTRVWWVESGSELTLRHLAVTDGVTDDFGAGLYNDGGSVTVSDCIFTRNHFEPYIYVYIGGGIFSLDGTLNIENSQFLDNGQAFEMVYGGGVAVHGGSAEIEQTIFWQNEALGDWYMDEYPGGGGLYVSNALVNVLESSFIDNNGGHGGGAIASAGVVTITNSTFVGNQALSWGGKGGAINNVSNLAIINSTFSENASEVGGGISNYRGNVHITNSTFAGNSATSFGGGINNFDIGSIYLSNTIIANHISGGDCSGDMVDNGNNLDSDGICGLDPNKGSLPNTDPALGPLQDNGGLTWTHALLRFSPAIDAGGEAVCPPADQRGVLRPIDGDGDGLQMCDMGAYEADVPPAEEIYLPLLCRF